MADAEVVTWQSMFDVYREHYRWGLWMRLFYRSCAGACAGGAVGSLMRGEVWPGQIALACTALMFLCFNRFFIGKFIDESEDGMRREAVRALARQPRILGDLVQ